MKKILLLISLAIMCLTHCYGQKAYNCLDSIQKAKILKWKNERDQFEKALIEKDSILLLCEEKNTDFGLQIESYQVSLDLEEKNNAALIGSIKRLTEQTTQQNDQIRKQDRKINSLKKQRLVFGGAATIFLVLLLL